MTRDQWPPGPGNDDGRPPGRSAHAEPVVTTPLSTPATIKTSRRLDCRPAHAWRAGFLRGRVDALRIAMREVEDPDTLAVLTRLADKYELAAGDT